MTTTKERWEESERIATELNHPRITKHEVYNKWSEIKGLEKREEIIAIVLADRFPYNGKVPEGVPKRKRAKPKPAKGHDALKLAFWFIDKCSSIDEAEKAFNAALKAIKEYNDD